MNAKPDNLSARSMAADGIQEVSFEDQAIVCGGMRYKLTNVIVTNYSFQGMAAAAGIGPWFQEPEHG